MRPMVLAACNPESAEKFPLMFIGTFWKQSSFRKQKRQVMGFIYYARAKDWMTQHYVFDWHLCLGKCFGQSNGRSILFLLDNYEGYGTVDSLQTLTYVFFYFLSPNSTSRIKPLAAEINTSLKATYRNQPIFRVFDNIDAEAENIYKVNICKTIR